MPEYVVSTVFKADNEMGKVFNDLSTKVTKLEKSTNKSFARMGKSAGVFKGVVGGILSSSAVLFGIGKLKQGISAVTENIIGFDQALVSAGSKLDVTRGTAAFRELGTAIRDVAAVTPFTAAETGKALDYLAMAGFNFSQSMANLPVTTNLAIAGEMDLARASDIASDALSALGLMTSDDQQLAKNLTRIGDVMVKTANTANTNVEMLWESLKPAASVATQLGGSVEYVSSMFGKLASSGVKAELAGTALRNMYLRLTSGTSEVEKVLKKYNIRVMDSKGKMLPLMDILEQASKAFSKLNDKQRQSNLTHLFGLRAVNSAMILMKEGKTSIDKYTESLVNAGGEMERVAGIKGQSLQNRIAAIKSRMVEAGLKIYDVMEKDILASFDKFENYLNNFEAENFVTWVKNTYNELKPLGEAVKNVSSFIIDFAAAGKKIGVGLDYVIGGFVGLKTAMWAGTAAATAFNIAAWPVTLTVGALGLAGYMLYKNWENVTKYFNDVVVPVFSNLGAVVTGSIGDIIRSIPIIGPLIKMYERLTGMKLPSLSTAIKEREDATVYKKELDLMLPPESKEVKAGEYTPIANPYSVQALSAEYIKTESIKAEPSEVNINFSNPPIGMTASTKQGRNAPKIRNDLGRFLK